LGQICGARRDAALCRSGVFERHSWQRWRTPVQNVGAYGQDVSETVESVETLDLKDNQVRELCHEACGFAYRSSISTPAAWPVHHFARQICAHSWREPRIRYADLERHFEDGIGTECGEIREAVRHIAPQREC